MILLWNINNFFPLKISHFVFQKLKLVIQVCNEEMITVKLSNVVCDYFLVFAN